jgi:hypothetical protein
MVKATHSFLRRPLHLAGIASGNTVGAGAAIAAGSQFGECPQLNVQRPYACACHPSPPCTQARPSIHPICHRRTDNPDSWPPEHLTMPASRRLPLIHGSDPSPVVGRRAGAVGGGCGWLGPGVDRAARDAGAQPWHHQHRRLGPRGRQRRRRGQHGERWGRGGA